MKMDIVLFFWIINSVFFSSETCCDFQGDLYKAIKVKRKAGTLGLVTNEKSQVSLFRVCIVHFPATTPLVSVLL